MAGEKPDDGGSVELITLEQVTELLLGGEVDWELEISDPEEIQREIVERILKQHGDDALEQHKPKQGKEYLWTPFQVEDVRWAKSTKKDNKLGAYAVMIGFDAATGENVLVNCGGINVMAQLVVLVRDDALPQRVYLRHDKEPTANGYYPLWLNSADKLDQDPDRPAKVGA